MIFVACVACVICVAMYDMCGMCDVCDMYDMCGMLVCVACLRHDLRYYMKTTHTLPTILHENRPHTTYNTT